MTIKISVELLRKLVFQSADLIGPATVQFVKLLDDSGILIDIDWETLAQLLTSPYHPDQIEDICFRAMKWGFRDLSKLVRGIEGGEKEGL